MRRIPYIISVTALSIFVVACVSTGSTKFPNASVGFQPQRVYAVEKDKLFDNLLYLLQDEKITVASTDTQVGRIVTGYIHGETQLQGIMSRTTMYAYIITLESTESGETRINILCKLSMSEGQTWSDVSKDNVTLLTQLENWLYEKIENSVAATMSMSKPAIRKDTGKISSSVNVPQSPLDQKVPQVSTSSVPNVIEPTVQFIVIRSSTANVRSEPNDTSKVIARVNKGVRLQKLGEEGDWVQVNLSSGQAGWIFKDLVAEPIVPQVSIPPVTNAIEPGVQSIVIRSSTANVRSEPNDKSKVISRVNKGVRLQKLGEEGDWVQVKLSSGQPGWIFKDLVKESP